MQTPQAVCHLIPFAEQPFDLTRSCKACCNAYVCAQKRSDYRHNVLQARVHLGSGPEVSQQAGITTEGLMTQGTLFTPLDKSTSTQSLNVQLRKILDLHVNLVHGFSIPGLQTRHTGIDIVVIRCASRCTAKSAKKCLARKVCRKT